MANQKKIEKVKKLNEELNKAKSVVLTDHTGLTHQQMEKLRRQVKKAGGNFQVVKNTLLRKSLKDTPFVNVINEEALVQPTSLLTGLTDQLAPLKELVKLVNEFNLPKIKQGALPDKILTSGEVIKLASLPDRKVLLTQVVAALKSPSQKLVFTLNGNLAKLVLILKAVLDKREKVN